MALTIPYFVGGGYVGAGFVGAGFTVVPDPLQNALRSALIVPRVPIRLRVSGDESPAKIDPRATKFTEIIANIFNGLGRRGNLFRLAQDEWCIPALPRVVEEANAFYGEEFFDPDTNELKYKTTGGTVYVLYPQGSGTGTVTSFSFTDANGFTSSVSNPTTTPNLTLTLDEVDGGGA